MKMKVIKNKLSTNAIVLKCPHFLITYGSLICNNRYIKINEIVDGNLKDLLLSKKKNIFFHKYIDAYYFGKDYNYLEINSGGYFYYNINFLHNLDKKF